LRSEAGDGVCQQAGQPEFAECVGINEDFH
jgi:hypothetical protein